jgi:hypothetical protein
MIPTGEKLKLVEIYCHVCDLYEKELKYLCQRFSNNRFPEFTDQEAIAVYLFAMLVENRFKVKHIHQFASDYLHD